MKKAAKRLRNEMLSLMRKTSPLVWCQLLGGVLIALIGGNRFDLVALRELRFHDSLRSTFVAGLN